MSRLFKINRHFLLFLAVCCILGSYLAYYIPSKAEETIDLENIGESADEQLENLQNLMNKTKSEFLKNFETLKTADNEEYFNIFDFCSELDYPILIYKDGKLKYWSSNTPSFATLDFSEKFTQKAMAIEAGNGWYLKKTLSLGSHTIVGLIPLKQQFFYQNKYLSDKFSPAFRIPDTWLVSGQPTQIGKEVRSTSGQYLFSVIPPVKKKSEEDAPPGTFSLLLFLIGFALLLRYVDLTNEFLEKYELSNFYVGITSLLVLILFFISIYFDIPLFVFRHASLIGDVDYGVKSLTLPIHFIRIAFIMLFFANNIFRIIPFDYILSLKFVQKKHVFVTLQIIVFLAMAIFFDSLVKTIHLELSQFNDKSRLAISRDNAYLIGIYVEIGILIGAFVWFSDKLFKLFAKKFKKSDTLILYISFVAVVALMSLLKIGELSLFELALFIFLHLFILFIHYGKYNYNLYSVSFLLFGVSIWVAILFQNDDDRFERRMMRAQIEKLTVERDKMAEHFLKEITPRLEEDRLLIEMLKNDDSDQQTKIREYLQKKYFYGFWDKYDLSLLLCYESPLQKNENHYDNCQRYYQKMYLHRGLKIPNTAFWNVYKENGGISYTGNFKTRKSNNDKVSLYISLTERLSFRYLGYPDLLVEQSEKEQALLLPKSTYAKYSKGKLVSKSGIFGYNLNDKDFLKEEESPYFVELDGYKHLVVRKGAKTLVVSTPHNSTQNTLTTVAYVFLLYFFMIAFKQLLINLRSFKADLFSGFKNRIRLAISILLLLAFGLFALSTVRYAVTQNKTVNNDRMREKMASVQRYLEDGLKKHQIVGIENINLTTLTEELRSLSQVYFADINLYNTTGELIASSRPEVFKKRLISTQMNSEAYKKMHTEKKSEFIRTENIGDLEYSSIYISLRDAEGKIITYVNMPYFMRNNSMEERVSNILVGTINVYVILFLVALFLALGITTGITYPLRMLQGEFRSLEIGKKQKKIEYKGKDEIGELVTAYNLMVDKLDGETQKLAETERENAWREMAKQIAHEIKNPLTPMKLHIQLLQKSWNEEHKDFEKQLNKVTYTLIEQINSLSKIASEFSAFAKMPKAKIEEVDIIKKLKNVKGLFENTPHINIFLLLNGHRDISVLADKQQILRVFINLVKNAIQAIPEDREGKITLSLYLPDKETVTVSITDNGMGIPKDKIEQLFEPTFTTKSSGSGIGLALVKSIVRAAGGTITFTTKENIGTTFYLTLNRSTKES